MLDDLCGRLVLSSAGGSTLAAALLAGFADVVWFAGAVVVSVVAGNGLAGVITGCSVGDGITTTPLETFEGPCRCPARIENNPTHEEDGKLM